MCIRDSAMDFRPIVAPYIRELFSQQVEGAIRSGQLKPGDRLPTERELADTCLLYTSRCV